MKLINNRYKLDKVLEDNLDSSIYEVIDFWNNDRRLFMNLYNADSKNKVIDYFIHNFIDLSKIKHKNLLTSDQFNIIKTIDRKKVGIRQYYSTTEYIDSPSIEKVHMNLNFKEKIYIVLEVCTILDFLHYKGVVYKHLSPSNIFLLLEDRNIKIMDLATIYERTINTDYDDLTRYFIAPEVLLGHEDIINKNADKYSLGMLMIYLLTEDFYIGNNKEFKYISESDLNNKQIKFLNKTIINLTNKSLITRKGSLREIIDNLNNLFHMDYEYDLVKERGVLNFQTKIIGRDRELEKILKIDDEFIENKDYKKAILVKGDTGVGKTKLLKEVSHLLKMRGRDVYYTEINEDDDIDLKPMTNILRQTIKDTPKNILNKYGQELVKVLPELRFVLEEESFNGIIEDKERLRLYDRITNYLEDLSKDKPIYLIIDNIENCSLKTLSLFDYIINNISRGTVLIIASFNEKILVEKSMKDIINRWLDRESTEGIDIPNLDLSEIGEFIKDILGISYKPLNFSAVMLKESQGNPRYIEYMMKDLFVTGELFFHTEGFWEIKTQKYSDIYFPSSIDEVIKNQINLIKDDHMDIMKIVSMYTGSISKVVLSKMLDTDSEDLNKKLDELIGMRLLDERVSDWGYSYSINNIQLKKLIYYQISQNERIKLHKEVAQLLEKTYSDDYKPILEELTYHLISSNQLEKALSYIVKVARVDANIFSSQSLHLWEDAYEISKDIESEYKLEILENLGRFYSIKGENDKALKVYGELLDESKRLGRTRHSVSAKVGAGEMYLKRNLIDLSLKEAKESRELSTEIGYLDGKVEAEILYNKILLGDGILKEVEKNMEYLLGFSINNNLNKDLGNIYNIMGLVKYFEGNIEEAILNYENSIIHFNKVGKFIDSTKPMNNIANIYVQSYGDKKKAMEYYEEGLKIIEKYGVLNTQLIFLNNIGEIYIDLCDYEKAKDYIEKARIISTDVEDVNMIFLTNINLGLIYLLTGDYDQSYNCYTMLKDNYSKNQGYNLEITSQYYNYLGEFYSTFGKWDESLKYSKKAMDICKEFNNKEYLKAKSRIVFAEYFKSGNYNKSAIEDIRIEYKATNLNFDRRNVLLYLAVIPFLEGDHKFVIQILQEDRELKIDYPNTRCDYIRNILLYSVVNDEYDYENIIKLEESMKKHNLIFIDIFSNALLGFKFFEDGKHYQAINYLLESLDLMYRLIKNIPDKELQISYVKSRRGDEIKAKLIMVVYNAFGEKMKCIYIDDLQPEDSIEKYFDYKPLFNLMNNEEFTKITENNYIYEEIREIYSIETLISKLTNDYESNLKFILKYLAKETFAQKGYILIYDEKSNKYYPIVSLDDDMGWSPNENLLALANRYEKGILINDNLGDNIIGLYREFLPKDTKSLLCIPITISKFSNFYLKKERRKGQEFRNQRNEGYIYLETGRVFNRFDDTRHILAYTLSRLLYINIENYKLKKLSTIDKLTGTYTRKYFENEFTNILNEAKRNRESLAILMIDIDRFKNINDTYGHRKGDEALNKIGNCIIKSVRSTDLVARYGGEEFVIILKNTNLDEARKIGEKIRYNVKNIKIPKIEDSITISVGISMFPKHSQFKEELIEKADQALYRSKEKGRNMVVVWDTHLANTLKRVDKLAGILSGNSNKDQRNVLSILDIIDLAKDDNSKEVKIYEFLGRLIETLEAENGALIELDTNKNPINTYYRSRQNKEWVKSMYINYTIVDRVIINSEGEFLIDWESIREVDLISNKPNWNSAIIIPLIFNGIINAVVYITVPIKEKEFDYNNYNLAKVLCGVFSTIM